MLAAADIQLAEETVRDLRAQGQPDRAAALEAVLAVATAAAGPGGAGNAGSSWTIRQAARATGQSGRLIRKLIATGKLAAEIRGGQTLVQPAALWACLDALAAEPQPEQVPNAHDRKAARQRRAFVEAGLPPDKLARLVHLHEQLERGRRLSQAEQGELVALERDVLAAAGKRVEAWPRQPAAPSA
jgi:hypothetical protein